MTVLTVFDVFDIELVQRILYLSLVEFLFSACLFFSSLFSTLW